LKASRVLGLPPLSVDSLAEVSRTAHQGDEDHRQLQVGAGACRISGEYAEAAGIGMHFGPDRDLHREVCNVRPDNEWIE
jgi:hypothetical protein